MAKIITTEQLRKEKLIYEDRLPKGKKLDPNGTHVFALPTILHNDVEIRSRILLKLAGQDEPFEGIVIVPIDLWNSLKEVTVS